MSMKCPFFLSMNWLSMNWLSMKCPRAEKSILLKKPQKSLEDEMFDYDFISLYRLQTFRHSEYFPFFQENEHAGIRTLRFIPPENAMGSHNDPNPARKNPDNECFCMAKEVEKLLAIYHSNLIIKFVNTESKKLTCLCCFKQLCV